MTFWTYALINILVSAAFLITLSKIKSISGSICFPKVIISSFKHSNAFFDTLDLRFYTKAITSIIKLWIELCPEFTITLTSNSTSLLSLFIISNSTFQSLLFIPFKISLNYLSGYFRGVRSSLVRYYEAAFLWSSVLLGENVLYFFLAMNRLVVVFL